MSFTNLREVAIKYDDDAVQNMLFLLKHSPLPSQAPVQSASPWSLGIDHDYLVSLRERFQKEWKWDRVEKEINQTPNFLVDYAAGDDTLELHFLHKRSNRADAIPLILLHGWPGTFFDFRKVIESLTNPPTPDIPAFHVVVPSLPGYFKSTLPRRDGWNMADTATVFNRLMVDLLGYKTYAGHGGDWGSMIMRVMSNLFPDTMTVVHFSMFRVPIPENLDRSKLTEVEKIVVERGSEFARTGFAYFQIQNTKPFTIGFAIGSSPLALLAYIGEKIYGWSDPERVDPDDILDTVALYWLSSSFSTSVVIYNQSGKERAETNLAASEGKWLVKSKSFGYSSFAYEIGGSPRAAIEPYGNLTYYKEHRRGGHFPALDNPSELVGDLREFCGVHF
ncbi:alpha/beta-hydrolase [Trametopsis cervina]|nr:alpha/beta-hydrolase [Trametopsis cervina]